VRARDTGGLGGFKLEPGQPCVRCGDERADLAGWRIRIGYDQKSLRPEPQPPRHNHSRLHNGMIAPLIPFAIRGAIWYQGESNVFRAYQYRTVFPAMIRDWREDWGQGDFPFYYVQIAPFDYRAFRPQTPAERWQHPSAELREAQLRSLATPNTGMIVTTDITDNVRDIHPVNKQDVGARLALWALAKTYGRTGITYSGPLYKSMTIEGDSIRLSFDHVGGGLVARGGELTEFTIAGEDRRFVPARATLDGDTILASSPDVKNPVAVRFGWTDTATPNLLNRAGLPASPFRTDDWPGSTDDAKW
jgi:sialate O-acetylesterase